MSFNITRHDKVRIILTTLGLVTGLFFMWWVETSHRNNPPPDADIGGGMIYLLGMIMAYANGVGLMATLLYVFLRGITKRTSTAIAVTFVIMALLVLAGWYWIIGAETIQKNSYKREIRSRYSSFVKYKSPIMVSAVSGESGAVRVSSTKDNSGIIMIDLHDCSPGLAKVTSATSTTYFAFSGVREDEHLPGFGRSVCELYIGKQTTGQAWEGMLCAKCIVRLGNELANNSLQLPYTASGIQFGMFLGNCQDSRTGVVPNDL